MITAERGADATRALRQSELWNRVLWHGVFLDTGAGVFVIDAEKPETIAAEVAALDLGTHVLDSWWSTASLARLAPAH
jgi:hypothetical protein